MRAGAQTELKSVLDHDSADADRAGAAGAARRAGPADRIARAGGRRPALPKRSTGLDANVEMRGVGERAWALRPEVKIIAGPQLQPGLRELIVGKGAREQFAGARSRRHAQAQRPDLDRGRRFDSGDAHDSELWADIDVVGRDLPPRQQHRLGDRAADRRRRPSTPSRPRWRRDPRLKVDVKTTRDYFTEQSAQLTQADPHPRHHDRRRSWRSARCSARSTPCTPRSRRARARSRRCARSAFAACRWSSR